MGQLRFQRTICLTALTLSVFNGLVLLWPESWRQLTADNWSNWKFAALREFLILAPPAAIFVWRKEIASRIIFFALLFLTLGYVWRYRNIITVPDFDRDLIFIKMDLFTVFYMLVLCIPCLIATLLRALYVLWRSVLIDRNGTS